jgi:Zn-dependent M28 family amino/carboxypeptidase
MSRATSVASRAISALAAVIALSACLDAQSGPRFDGQKAYEHVRAMVALGPRPAGSAALGKTRDYIKKELSSAGLKVEEQAFEASTPAGPIRMVNLRAMVGPSNAKRIIVAGHYDTKLFKNVRFVGANDGGSSAALLIELGRALAGAPLATPIELLFLDGEEAVRTEWQDPDNRYGSRFYVNAARKDGTLGNIQALVLVDMIGDRDLRIKREAQSTAWLTDVIWSVAAGLGRPQFVNEETEVIDDHLIFLEAGVPAVDLIDFEYPAWHTPADTLDKVSAASLQVVGDVVLASLRAIEKRISERGR